MCEEEHDGLYGTGRFCNQKCARGFSTKAKRSDINTRVSLALKKGYTKEERNLRKVAKKHAVYSRKAALATIYNVSSRTAKKILIRMGLPCSRCGWFVEGVSCDLHHIIPVCKGGLNLHSNLSHICPNCHRLVHSGVVKPSELISFEDYVGDDWKQFYFTRTIGGDGQTGVCDGL